MSSRLLLGITLAIHISRKITIFVVVRNSDYVEASEALEQVTDSPAGNLRFYFLLLSLNEIKRANVSQL